MFNCNISYVLKTNIGNNVKKFDTKKKYQYSEFNNLFKLNVKCFLKKIHHVIAFIYMKISLLELIFNLFFFVVILISGQVKLNFVLYFKWSN